MNYQQKNIDKKEWIQPVFERQSLKDALADTNAENALGTDFANGKMYS